MAEPKETFDSAYIKLEATIRNFSREKLSYESNIAKQNLTIISLKSNIESLNSYIQKLESEKQQTENAWKRDEEHRCSVEAALIESENKIDAYAISLRHFENVAQSISNHIGMFEYTTQTCKLRQIELLDHIFATEEQNIKEKKVLQDETKRLESELLAVKDDADCRYKEYDEEVNNLSKKICEINLSLEHQKDQFGTAEKEYNMFVRELRGQYDSQLSEKDAALSALTQKYEELEVRMNTTVTNTNVLQIESAGRIKYLEGEIVELKETLQLEKDKFEKAVSDHTKTTNSICSDREQRLREKDAILETHRQNASEIQSKLNDSLAASKTALENREEQLKGLQVTISELHTSTQRYAQELQDKNEEHRLALEKFQNRCSHYESQIEEKNFEFCQLEGKLSETEEQMEISVSEANQRCEDYILKVKTLTLDLEEKKTSMESIECILAAKEEFIITLEQKNSDNEMKAKELEKQLQTTFNNFTSQIEQNNTKINSLELKITELQSSLQNEKETFENTVKSHDAYVSEIIKDHQLKINDLENNIATLEETAIQTGETWLSTLNGVNGLLEMSNTKIKDLEAEIAAIATSKTNLEEDLHNKCKEHRTMMENLAKTNKDNIDEKNALITESERKFAELEDKLNASLHAATTQSEESFVKLTALEAEINMKNASVENLNSILREKGDEIISLDQKVEDLQQSVQDHRSRSIEYLNNFREISQAKETMEYMYEEKLKSIKKELQNTSEELANLKSMYNSRERAITKFMLEAKPTIPISFQNSSQPRVKAPATTYTTSQEIQEKPQEPKNKINNESKETSKQPAFSMSPKSYGKSTPTKNMLTNRLPNRLKSIPSGILKPSTSTAAAETTEKKVSFKNTGTDNFDFNKYFSFDTSASSGNSDNDSPKKPKKSNLSTKTSVPQPKIGGSKRIAIVESGKSTPPKRDKSDTGTDADPITETPKTPARKFFRSRRT